MNKKKKKDKLPEKYLMGYSQETSSEFQTTSNATLSPSMSIDDPTTLGIFQKGSTSAPTIGESDEDEKYVSTWPALAEKHLLGSKSLPASYAVILCLIVGAFIFIQDNGKGLLVDIISITWTISKWLIFSLLVLMLSFVVNFLREHGPKNR